MDGTHELHEEAGDELVALLDVDPSALPEAGVAAALVDAHRVRARLDAAIVALTDRLDAGAIWAADGARHATGWLTATTSCSVATARTEQRLARELRTMPHVSAAARAGHVTRDQVHALVGAREPGLEDAFALCEATLVAEVAPVQVVGGRRYLRRWVQGTREALGLDDDGTEPFGGQGPSTARLSPVGDRWAGDLDLTAEHGEILATAIDHMIDEMWQCGVFTSEDGLSPAERRADALVELVRRGSSGGPDDGTARPLILALTAVDRLRTRPPGHPAATSAPTSDAGDPDRTAAGAGAPDEALSDEEIASDRTDAQGAPADAHPAGATGSPAPITERPGGSGPSPARSSDPRGNLPGTDEDEITPFPAALSELARAGPVPAHVISALACEGTVVPLSVGEGPDQLRMGRTLRIANRAQRRALRIRDGGCVFPGCDAAPEHCIAHHLTWWEHGGRTDIENLALLCRHHHTLLHKGTFTMLREPDGTVVTRRADQRPTTPVAPARTAPLPARPTPEQRQDEADRIHAIRLARLRIAALIRDARRRRREPEPTRS